MDTKSRQDYSKFVVGNPSGISDGLPMQMLPRSRKGKKFQEHTMDVLENIGIRQIRENRGFRDYRRMLEGRMAHTSFDETQTDLRQIQSMREEQDLPTFIKHYDLIGKIINLLIGQFNKQRQTINIHATDMFSTSDFLREKDSKIHQFTEEYFNKIIEIGLIEKGLDPNKQDFQSEEEKQAYLEQLKQERDAIIPPDEIEKDLSKNFRTAIVEWAESTLESNYKKFKLEMLDMEELKDYLISGRYFRHYYVGYDSFEPETWDIERTFFSQDLDVKYPQDCEYVGTIHLLSGAKLLSRFGHLIPKNIQAKIYGEDFYTNSSTSVGPLEYIQKGGGTPTVVPHAGYLEKQTAYAFQELIGQPWGKQHYVDQNGEQQSRASWVTATNGLNTSHIGVGLRDDINVRRDSIQVTEAYFRSQRLVGLITVENPLTEQPYQEMVEEDILPEVLEKYNIKKQNTKSWEDVVRNPKENINTITYGYLPEIWKGYKINATNTNLKEDYYFGIGPLDYQITGIRNEFDVKIPVAGVISSAIGEKIRSIQVDYNIVKNQNRQYLEKTVGAFFTMDWNLLPSQFKNNKGETTAELLEEWREQIREMGFALTDGSPQNTKGLNPNQNGINQYNISFIDNIKLNMELARQFENDAYAVIGISPQQMGQPSEYMTAEGVKVGNEAQYAQTEEIYKRFNTAKIAEKELELAVSQYCATNSRDISVNYINGQKERIIQNFTDENFSFRKLEVLPDDDSGQRRELEIFKQQILNRNTMDSDIYELGQVVTADNFVTLMEYGLKQRKRLEKAGQEEHQRKMELQEKQNEAFLTAEKAKLDREDRNKQLDRESEEYQTEVKAMATLADSNTDPQLVDRLRQAQDQEKARRDSDIKNNQKQQEIDLKISKEQREAEKALSEMSIEMQKLKEAAKDRAQRRQDSQNNLLQTRINKR